IGGSHADLGEIEEAARAHLKAEAMFALLTDRSGELAEALALAQLHHLLGELDAAQRTYLRALALQQKNADVTALCWAEGGLVDVRTRRGDTAEALDTLRQTLEIASANDLRRSQGRPPVRCPRSARPSPAVRSPRPRAIARARSAHIARRAHRRTPSARATSRRRPRCLRRRSTTIRRPRGPRSVRSPRSATGT